MFEIPKMKLFIYALTFLGYAYSGYGSGILTNLRDAVLAAETVFKDVLGNVVIIAQKFRDVHDIFDAAVEEHCEYKCPNDGVAVRNKLHKPSSDGCGSYGISIEEDHLPHAKMTSCCDEHDLCYDTCGSMKEKCDLDFKRCLYKICEESPANTVTKACKAAAKMLFTGTMTLGCKSYVDSQANACYCLPPKKSYTKYPGGP